MSICPKCNTDKDVTSFHKNKRICKPCRSLQAKKYREKNLEACKMRSALWYKENRQESIYRLRKYKEENRGRFNMYQSKRRASQLQRNPSWLSEEDLFVITEIYALSAIRGTLTGTKCNVDHVIPLQGNLISGLHVPENLKIIPANENFSKGNRYEV